MFIIIQVEISISVLAITQYNPPSCITTKALKTTTTQERKGKGSDIIISNS